MAKRSSEYSRKGGGGNGISQSTSLLSDLESCSKIIGALAPFLQPRWRHKSVALIGILNDQTSSPSLITTAAGTAALTAISHKLRPLPLKFWIASRLCVLIGTTPWRPPGSCNDNLLGPLKLQRALINHFAVFIECVEMIRRREDGRSVQLCRLQTQ